MADDTTAGAATGSATPSSDPLVIRSLDFLGPMASPNGWRPEIKLPEVAFAGRSNVGKSSLLNRLVKRRAFARVSKTPGRTREINFFSVNGAFTLVDLPGYGYARISKERREEWRPLIEEYLKHSPALRGIVMLLDARHDPGADDLRMIDFLGSISAPTIIAVTKIDKLRTREREERLAALAGALALDPEQLLPFSAVTGEGRDELAASLMALLDGEPWRDI